jgi:hypothetical protein
MVGPNTVKPSFIKILQLVQNLCEGKDRWTGKGKKKKVKISLLQAMEAYREVRG